MKNIISCIIISVLIIGCAKWVSADFSKETVVIISPADNHSDSLQAKSFNWFEMEGSNKYQLQIVSPSFDSIIVNILDSAITSTNFNVSLAPGKYQWRVRAVNDDFLSLWTIQNLEITSSTYLTGQTIVGISPSTGSNTNNMNLNLIWNKLISTDTYLIQIYDESQNLIDYFNTTSEAYSFKFTNEGIYTVSIQAINDISASIKTEVTLRIDTTSPNDVTLTYPNWDTVSVFPTTFKWNLPVDNGGAITEQILIGTDSLFNNTIIDTTITSSSSIKFDTIPGTSKLYWKVNRLDAAGNVNNGGVTKRFWIN